MTLQCRPSLALILSLLLGIVISGCGSVPSYVTTPPGATMGLSTAQLAFPAQLIGTTSAPLTATLTNNGVAPLTFGGVSVVVNNPNANLPNAFAATTTCGATIAVGASCTVSATFSPVALPSPLPAGSSLTENYVSSLYIAGASNASPVVITLTGAGVSPTATLSATTLSFTQGLGATSAAQTVTLSNTGNGVMSLTGITVGGTNASNFAQTNTCGATIAPSANCVISVTFTPNANATFAATLTIADSAATSPQTITLAGTVPVLTLSASTLTFTAQNIATSSPVQTVTLTNPGTATVTVSGITLGGTNASNFTMTTTCGTGIAAATTKTAAGTCTVTVTFSPTVTGSLTATVSIADNAGGSPQTITLNGTGINPVASLSGTTLTFAAQDTGTTSPVQTVTLSNTGSATLTVAGITLGGTNATSFAQTNNCGATLSPNTSCVISVTFSPTATGTFAATIAVADNATGSPQTIALTGTGVVPVVTLAPASLSFTQGAGTTSNAQVVLLTNTGAGPLNITGITLGGANASSFTALNSCGTTVAAGANCTVTVTFSPTAVASYAATVSIADNAAGSPQTIPLTGTGTLVPLPAISYSVPSLAYTAAAESTSATQTVTITNTGNATLNISSVATSGTNAWNFPMTNTCGATLAAGANCTATVAFNPSLAAAFSANLTVTGNTNPTTTSLPLTGTGTGTLTINTLNATDWQIANGALTIDWNSQTSNLWGVHLNGYTDNMVDVTTTSNGQPDGLYMDNTGQGSGTVTSGYSQVGNEYIDWWQTVASNTTNAFTYSQHYIVTANDTGFHIYSTVAHSATDIAGSIGQWQYVFRINLTDFNNTYTVNEGLGNLGVQTVPQPATSVTGNSDPGRQVSNAVLDMHGLTIPTGFLRQFYTKYDYASYEYLHQEHGLYGTAFGSWMVISPYGKESMVGGPTKQDLIFTNNINMMEALSNHFALSLGYTPPQGVATTRLFGPFYYHFNAFTATNTTPAQLYAEAQTYLPAFNFLYDSDATLVASSYVKSTARGAVSPTITNGGSSTQYQAWSVLSDPATNLQYTTQGRQYWVNQNATGTAGFTGVVPGTYRLSSYVLGQWGEARMDNVVVTANQTTTPTMSFTPENFGTATPIWTIGTPDRSGHEFLHGRDSSGNDFRDFWGSFDFWHDFASTNGTQVYYATAEGSTPATNNPAAINYVQWGTFDPGLFGGVYNAADDTTDGYNYIIPAYVATLSGHTGTDANNSNMTPVPPLTIHFTTTAAQQAQGTYSVLSVGVACTEGDVFVTLNGQTQLIWHDINASDCMVRSGLSGYYQWIAFQWNTSALNAPGADNVLQISSNHSEGFTWDALRFEITNKSAAPGTTGWNDYEYLYGSTYIPANDTIPNP